MALHCLATVLTQCSKGLTLQMLQAEPLPDFLQLPSIHICACLTSTDNTGLMLIMSSTLLLQLWLL